MEPWGYKIITVTYVEGELDDQMMDIAESILKFPHTDRIDFVGQLFEEVKERPIEQGGT